MTERRRTKRIIAKSDITIKSKKIDPLLISLENISKGGICVATSEALYVGEYVNLSMNIEEEKFNVIGQVIWVKEKEDYYSIGIELVFVNDEFINKLEGIILGESELH